VIGRGRGADGREICIKKTYLPQSSCKDRYDHGLYWVYHLHDSYYKDRYEHGLYWVYHLCDSSYKDRYELGLYWVYRLCDMFMQTLKLSAEIVS
jgi:hypothetical protein